MELHALASDGRQIRLRVSDTGVGLPADFASRRHLSLGLQLVEDLARQIGGQLEIGDGALFSVTFRTEDVPAASGTPVQNTRTIHHTSHG